MSRRKVKAELAISNNLPREEREKLIAREIRNSMGGFRLRGMEDATRRKPKHKPVE